MPEEQKVFPIDPTPIMLADGKPRELRYTNGSFKRAKKSLGLKSMREVFALEFSEIAGVLIHAGLVNPDVTPDEIDDLIPTPIIGDIQAIVMSAMSGSSVEEVKNALRAAAERQMTPPETMNQTG